MNLPWARSFDGKSGTKVPSTTGCQGKAVVRRGDRLEATCLITLNRACAGAACIHENTSTLVLHLRSDISNDSSLGLAGNKGLTQFQQQLDPKLSGKEAKWQVV